jgi:hypothetical protein
MSKPLIIEIENAKADIVSAVNTALSERGVPCYFLDKFLFDLAKQVSEKAKAEVEYLRKQEEQTEAEEAE